MKEKSCFFNFLVMLSSVDPSKVAECIRTQWNFVSLHEFRLKELIPNTIPFSIFNEKKEKKEKESVISDFNKKQQRKEKVVWVLLFFVVWLLWWKQITQ
jgi:cytoskeletal protein RodZ